jgi:hypothetical protein
MSPTVTDDPTTTPAHLGQVGGGSVDDHPTNDDLTDDELAAVALAADADEPLPDDAVSLWELDGDGGRALLPDWYMPVAATGTRRLRGWRRTLAWVLVLTFFAIDGVGLCSTYGPILMGR